MFDLNMVKMVKMVKNPHMTPLPSLTENACRGPLRCASGGNAGANVE
jgi:hypothetical protein